MKSMTGFGKGVAFGSNCEITVELKSVNGRFFELGRIPKNVLRHEDSIVKILSQRIKRGIVDITVSHNGKDSGRTLKIDWELAREYVRAAKKIRTEFVTDEDFNTTAILRSPEVVTVSIDNQSTLPVLLDATKLALQQLDSMRIQEGESIRSYIKGVLSDYTAQLDKIKSRASIVNADNIARFRQRIRDLVERELDENRLLIEVALMADKQDISEEVVRIQSHLLQFDSAMRSKEDVGRKMDFLLQELLRETNTIGSKTKDIAVINGIVVMKLCLEKIKEQVRNIE